MLNPYRNSSNRVGKLKKQLDIHKSLIIGVDFDFTLYDPIEQVVYQDVLEILLLAQKQGHILCSWSANTDENLVRRVWKECGLRIDYYNDSPAFKGNRKPHFNILLDDIAGLDEAISILKHFI